MTEQERREGTGRSDEQLTVETRRLMSRAYKGGFGYVNEIWVAAITTWKAAPDPDTFREGSHVVERSAVGKTRYSALHVLLTELRTQRGRAVGHSSWEPLNRRVVLVRRSMRHG